MKPARDSARQRAIEQEAERKRALRPDYRAKFFDLEDAAGAIAPWVGVVFLLAGCCVAMMLAFHVTIVGILPIRLSSVTSLAIPGGIVLASVVVYALSYWRSLRVDVYVLGVVLGVALGVGLLAALQATPVWAATALIIPGQGRVTTKAGDWGTMGAWFTGAWAVAGGCIVSILSGLGVGSDDGFWSGCGAAVVGIPMGAIAGAIIGATLGAVVDVTGWMTLGLAMGALTAAIIYITANSNDAGDELDLWFGATLIIAAVVMLLVWGINSWGLGISAIYTLEWSVAVVMGMMTTAALMFTLHSAFVFRS